MFHHRTLRNSLVRFFLSGSPLRLSRWAVWRLTIEVEKSCVKESGKANERDTVVSSLEEE